MRQIPSGIHSKLFLGAIKCSRTESFPMAGGIPSKVSLLLPRKSLFSLVHLQMFGYTKEGIAAIILYCI